MPRAKEAARRLGTPKAFATWACCVAHSVREERTAVVNLMVLSCVDVDAFSIESFELL
jgi:hypothetical protein